MRAIYSVQTVNVVCPKCNEPQAEPQTGSLMWEVADLMVMAGQTIQCPCGASLTLRAAKDRA